MDLIIISMAVFCILTGAIIGFLFQSVPRLVMALGRIADKVDKISDRFELETMQRHVLAQDLNHMKVCMDGLRKDVQRQKEEPSLPVGVYEETPDGRLVAIDQIANNAPNLPGGLPGGLRPSQIHR